MYINYHLSKVMKEQVESINSLSNDKISDWTKSKAFAVDKLDAAKITSSV